MQTKPHILIFSLCLLFGATLAGCDNITATSTPAPVFTPDAPAALTENRSSGGVTASGIVVPAREAQLSFAQSGWVKQVDVEVGDQVEAGQVLAELEGRERLEAALVTAETEVLEAQLALDDLYEDMGASQAKAYQTLIDANQSVGDARRFLYYFTIPADMRALAPLEALGQAVQRLEDARRAYEPYKYLDERDQWLLKKKHDEQFTAAKDELEWAQSDFNTAMRRLELESALLNAQADLECALEDYEAIQDGPDLDDVALSEARLKNAQASLGVAQAALDQAAMLAPFDGAAVTVEVYPGETVLPGKVVLILGDLDELQVETSDLSERDISEVALGQSATVYIEALSLEFSGMVAGIAPQADTIGGDVVYQVTIALDEQSQGLRWGMSAEVEIDTE